MRKTVPVRLLGIGIRNNSLPDLYKARSAGMPNLYIEFDFIPQCLCLSFTTFILFFQKCLVHQHCFQ
jgi:hypothetical protein